MRNQKKAGEESSRGEQSLASGAPDEGKERGKEEVWFGRKRARRESAPIARSKFVSDAGWLPTNSRPPPRHALRPFLQPNNLQQLEPRKNQLGGRRAPAPTRPSNCVQHAERSGGSRARYATYCRSWVSEGYKHFRTYSGSDAGASASPLSPVAGCEGSARARTGSLCVHRFGVSPCHRS